MFIQEAHVQKDIPREEDVTRPLSEREERRGEEVEVGGGGGSWPRNRKTLGNEKVMLRPATSPRASASSSDPQTCGGWTNNEPPSRGCLPGVGERRGEGGRKVLGENFCEDRGESSFALDRSLEDSKLSAIEINNSWDLKTGGRGG